MSGHHGQIAQYRRRVSLQATAQHRPDLIEQARAQGRLNRQDEHVLTAMQVLRDDAASSD
jgi:tRNA (guanine37-N1)-methyltransferase